MATYKNYNFVFFILERYIHRTILLEAAALTNVRAVAPRFVKDDGVMFFPQRFSNNPFAFKDPEKYSKPAEHFFENDFPVKNPLCFVFYEMFYPQLKAVEFFSHLKENYPGCKLVLWLDNPIHEIQSVRKMFVDKSDTKEILSTFDCVFTYNQVDAMDYGFTYFEGPYTVLPFEQPEQDIDIFYVGQPKDRLEKILQAYEAFKAAGFVCDFYIAGVNTPPRLPDSDDLHFNGLPYEENLKHILRSRAILDISQRETYGLTVRYFESLAYNKNFITNNAFYRQARFNSPKLFLIDKNLEIDKEQFMAASKLSSNYRNEYSSLHLISFLEAVLNS